MTERQPDFDSLLSNDKNLVSKATLDKRSKEKKEAEEANKKKDQNLNTISLNRETLKRTENRIKDLETEKTNLEIKVKSLEKAKKSVEKSWSKWVLWEIEREIRTLNVRIKSIEISLNNSKVFLKWTKDRIQKLEREYEITLKNHLKEKQEFDSAHKKALDEFRTNVKKNNERAQKQKEYNKVNSEIRILNWKIAKVENNLKTKRIELKNKENELNREKATTNTYVRELANLYRDAELVIWWKDPSKAELLSLISDGNLKILKGKYSNNNQILNNINTKANKLKIILQIQPTINKLKTEISNLENQKTNLISQKIQKENSKNNILTNAKQKWINLV